MTNYMEYKLCGGVFYSLLVQTCRDTLAGRQRLDGSKASHRERDILKWLIKLVNPEYHDPGNSLTTSASRYKKCILSANSAIPLDDEISIKAFDNTVHNEYQSLLTLASEFANDLISSPSRKEWFVKAILVIVRSDTDINEEALFFTRSDGAAVSKKNMLAMSEFEFESFLLGIWHFIVTKRPNNEIGKNTFEALFEKHGDANSSWDMAVDIAQNWNNNILIKKNDFDKPRQKNEPLSVVTHEDLNSHIRLLEQFKVQLKSNTQNIDMLKIALDEDKDSYFKAVENKYSKVKTLLYGDAPHNFYDFYVCNSLIQPGHSTRVRFITLENVGISDLLRYSKYILITGNGGLGKSMMMRHLLLDTTKNYDELQILPVLLTLRYYSDRFADLKDFIFDTYHNLNGKKSENSFEELLLSGKILLLFDGLDEMQTNIRYRFLQLLDRFIDKYPKNTLIISSRPYSDFVNLSRFSELRLHPLTKPQALQLIDRLDFRPDAPEIKKKFRQELDVKLYSTHTSFANNPMLLTLMLMTFEEYAEIPSKMHIFYHDAYVVLAQKHDANKGYKRTLHTGVSAEDFANYFAEFCGRTYINEKYKYTEREFDEYFRSLTRIKKADRVISASDFRYDLINNLCLMYYEGGSYNYIHRSFQEYFAALYYSQQKDKYLYKIGVAFEKKRKVSFHEKTFEMLYDMIPEKIEEYIFEPFLKSIIEEWEKSYGYWTFLTDMYPSIDYAIGDSETSWTNNPDSFLYTFIVNAKKIKKCLSNANIPPEEDFLVDEWAELDEVWFQENSDCAVALVKIEDVPFEYIAKYGEPKIIGRNYTIDTGDLYDESESYPYIFKLFESETFPLKQEYRAVLNYYQSLVDKHNAIGDDFFDGFT